MEPAREEAEWIRRTREGDAEAFAALVHRYQRLIHALAYRMTGSLADADDLAQEVFLRAYQRLDGYRGDSKFSSWLYRIAVNTCLNWRKSRQRRQQLHDDWAAEQTAPREGGAGDVGARVQEALLRLPAEQRAAVILTVCDGLNHAEAARALGCAETTVSWRVFRARRQLREWLAG